jgi:hypothetical protein
LLDPTKFTQIWIFGLKTNHLATLAHIEIKGPSIFFWQGLISLNVEPKFRRDENFLCLSPIEILNLEQVCMYVGTGHANILGERTPCKKSADLPLRQGNLLQRKPFSAVYKTSLHFTKNRVETS